MSGSGKSEGPNRPIWNGFGTLGRGVDLVETGPHSPVAALVKVSPAPMLVR
jgi:hypothetical protein